jgi:TolB-like protein
MSFIAELKRRNVIRAAGLYLVGAWLVVQVSSTVLPMFGAPAWLPRSIVILLLVGFLPAMIFSWVFELTPDGIKRDDEVTPEESIAPQTARSMDRILLVVAALAIGYFAFDKFVLTPRREAAMLAQASARSSDGNATQGVHADTNSIAVLPFRNMSSDKEQAYFADGMAEEILNALTRVKSLRVLGRSSSFQYKDQDIAPQVIGKQLGVAHLLTGSVLRQGEQLRIVVALIDTRDGVQQWSNQYDGKLADVFALQDSCARDIATQLNAVLGDNGKQRLVDKSSDNADAYALFVTAQSLVNKRVGDSLPRAIAMLDQATKMDPKFARAWSQLAVAYAVLPQYTPADWKSSWRTSDDAAQHALALDPDDAEAHAALSYNQSSQRHFTEMAAPMQRALELAPDNSAVNFWAANELSAMGRTRDAEVRIDAALVHDPANTLLLFYKSMLLWRAGDDVANRKILGRSNMVNSRFADFVRGYLDFAHGKQDVAAAEITRSISAFGSKIPEADLLVIVRGSFTEAARPTALKVIAAHTDDDWAPSLLLQLGEYTRSFDLYEHGGSGLSDGYLNWLWQPEPWARKARQSPAFQGFAKRIGILDYWKKFGWPDLCKPAPAIGPDAFTCQ